jgi:hypothetical protein
MYGFAEDLDVAVLDRVDEQLEVGLPDLELRHQLVHLYFQRYLVHASEQATSGTTFLQRLGRRTRALVSGSRAKASDIDMSAFDSVSSTLLLHSVSHDVWMVFRAENIMKFPFDDLACCGLPPTSSEDRQSAYLATPSELGEPQALERALGTPAWNIRTLQAVLARSARAAQDLHTLP